ncbi:hypothetical protein GCM10010112_78590 [Actinoplanes lobatus]|uniref:Uncharacterized protein n=1 Tax=Actinoplanes lobatus TaxID=113568 RepID=A0A7W7HMX6_9ACTN|nr:hypothetical protein [Actinoplanes lobatus]MBB4753474.1 hypothetical protein [Actinoplanes lobatus]GGN91927.1 hypothetical protein GCM10010112_78590 [Actinoplanes lobatus]GIE38007.1 hypothetical protein Alo02nite_09050 [Actinoplanes lobatus]
MAVRTILRWPAMLAGLVGVLSTAASAPRWTGPSDGPALYAECREAAQEVFEKYRDQPNTLFDFVCAVPDGTPVDPGLWIPAAPVLPAPTPVLTAGHEVCVTGPGRPVTGTALTKALANGDGAELVYEYEHLGGGETMVRGGASALEFRPGDLAPGASYRWRARVDDPADRDSSEFVYRSPEAEERRWSPWCEFTVSADAVDYRELGDVSLEALTELGLRPDRPYTISLSGAQRRLLRKGTDIGTTTARMTRTGLRWTDLLTQLDRSAFFADELALEIGDESPRQDGIAYRRLLSELSVKLGGPRHPHLA